MIAQSEIKRLKQDILKNSLFKPRASLAKCFADPTCLRILYILNNTPYACPSDFSQILDLSLPTVSHQLAKLRQMNIVTSFRDGQIICYSIGEGEEALLVKKSVQTLLA
ncbi:MAG: ArsR/SmtB family transcription factor [Candidatus Levyibacteriota bacterium]